MTFEAAYAAYWPLAFGAALKVLRDREAAEDAAGEAMLRAWREWATVRNVPAYLSTVTRRVALDALRRRQRWGMADIDTVAPFLIAPARPDAWADVVPAIRQLPARQRGVLVAFAAGYSYEEIAARMRSTVQTVKTWLVRARRRLRTILDGGPFPKPGKPRLPGVGKATDQSRAASRARQSRSYQARKKEAG